MTGSLHGQSYGVTGFVARDDKNRAWCVAHAKTAGGTPQRVAHAAAALRADDEEVVAAAGAIDECLAGVSDQDEFGDGQNSGQPASGFAEARVDDGARATG